MIKNILRAYGNDVQIIRYENNEILTEDTKAFIQPLRYISKMYQEEYMNSGYIDLNNYLYIGDSSVRLDLYPFGTLVCSNGDKYIIKKAKKVSLKGEVIYIWAILQEAYSET